MNKSEWIIKRNWCIKYKLIDRTRIEKLCILAKFAGLNIDESIGGEEQMARWQFIGYLASSKEVVCQEGPIKNSHIHPDDLVVTYTEVMNALKETLSRQVHQRNKKKVIAR